MNIPYNRSKSPSRSKHSLVLSIAEHLKYKPSFLVTIITLGFYFFLFAVGENFKFAVIAALLMVTLYYLVTKNLFVSLFSAFLASAPFLTPAKQYEFEYASASEYVFTQWPNGIISSIKLTISNLLGILIVLFILLEVIKRIIQSQRLITNPFVIMLNLPLFKFISFCWLGYFSVSLYSSLYHSFYPEYSLYLLFEYSKLLIGFIGIIYLFVTKTKSVKYTYIVLLTMLLFQNIVGFFQFVTSLGNNNNLYTQDAEENIPFARIDGISFHANIHAFIILMLLILILPYIAKRRGWIFNSVVFLSIANIFLSQSRTAWLGMIVIIAYVSVVFRNQTIKFIITLMKLKKMYRIVLLSLLTSLIILPRLQASSLFINEEGGGRLRARMILEGWQILQESPFVGFGLGTGVKVFLTNSSESYATTFPQPIHFAFLELALESGIPGAIFFYAPFLVFLFKYTHLLIRPRRHSQLVLLSAMCGMLILLVNHSLQPAFGQLEFYLIGIALGSGVLSLSKINPEIYL